MAREGEGQREAKERWRSFGVTRGQLCKQEVAEGGPRRQVALDSGGAEEQRREAGWRWKKGLNCNFQNFQGQNCKQAITFKLGLK